MALSGSGILWIIPVSGQEGSMIFAYRTLHGLQELGLDIHVFEFRQRGNLLGLLQEWLRARKLIRAQNIKYVHAQFGTITALFSMLLLKPYFVTFRGTDLNGELGGSALVNGARLWMSRLAAFFARDVILVSQTLNSKLISTRRKPSVIPSGTDTKVFYPRNRAQACVLLGLDPSKIYVTATSSRGRRVKRFDISESVILRLREKFPAISLIDISGKSPDEVASLLSLSSLFLLPSEREGSPNIVREALACGTPVCAFNVGDVDIWLKKDKQSVLANAGDTEGLYQGALHILTKEIKHEVRVNVNEFSMESHLSRMHDFYAKNLT